jgi:hypothetical protein
MDSGIPATHRARPPLRGLGDPPKVRRPSFPDAQEPAMAATVITYERGSATIENVADGKTCFGLVGTLSVGGFAFDTIERIGGGVTPFVNLKPKDYPMSTMYWHPSKGRVINPYKGPGASAQMNNILVHKGSVPSHFEGCIGPGFLESKGSKHHLSLSKESMEIIWEQCGGAPGVKPAGSVKPMLIVTFRVVGEMPKKSATTDYGG